MKKFIYSMLAFMFVLPLALGLAGCKNGEAEKQLTNADFVGEWYVEKQVYTETGHDSETVTLAEFTYMHDHYDDLEPEDKVAYEDLEVQAFFKFYITENGFVQVLTYYDTTEWSALNDDDAVGTWEITNNQLHSEIDPTYFDVHATIVVAYENGKIVVNVTGTDYTNVLTLAKVAE